MQSVLARWYFQIWCYHSYPTQDWNICRLRHQVIDCDKGGLSLFEMKLSYLQYDILHFFTVKYLQRMTAYFKSREIPLWQNSPHENEFSFRTQKKGPCSSFITSLGQTKVSHNIPQLYLDLDKRFMRGTRLLVDHLLCTAGKKHNKIWRLQIKCFTFANLYRMLV